MVLGAEFGGTVLNGRLAVEVEVTSRSIVLVIRGVFKQQVKPSKWPRSPGTRQGRYLYYRHTVCIYACNHVYSLDSLHPIP